MTTPFFEQLQASLAPAYTLERELAGGGMSRVFVATEKALGRKVVIKVLPPELGAGVNIERFRREIQLAAQLHHPHIVPLLSAGEHGHLLYYTMPFIEGSSLRSRLRREGKLSVREVVRVLHDVVDALAYAHARGIIHRDIKPDNILVLGTHALVTDFGVAKALSAALPQVGTTTAGMAIGTPAYMAPEQLAGDPAADHRLDIYAVGLLAYELFTGESPFTGTSPQAIMAAQLTRLPEPLHQLRPDVSPELSAIIMRCLAKSPDERPQSAEMLVNELDAVTTPQGAVITSTPVTAPSARPAPRRRRLVVGALVAGVAALAIVLSSNESDENPASDEGDPSVIADAGKVSGAGSGSGAPAAAAARDAAPANVVAPARSPVALSRADSLAIAEAMRRESAGKPKASVDAAVSSAESLQVYVQRVLTDSLRVALESLKIQLRAGAAASADAGAAQGAGAARAFDPRGFDWQSLERGVVVRPILPPPSSGKLRVVVTELRNATGRPDLEGLGHAIADSLRRAMAARGQFETVDARVTSSVPSDGNRLAMGWALRADLVLSGVYTLRREGLVIQAQVTDVRQGRVTRAYTAPPAPIDAPMSSLQPVIERAVTEINRLQSGARRTPRAPRQPEPHRTPG
ncbi:MAG TPA: serine/threonine-protein kinase [Gemmatimonadaceae bacterium]|nr:serine/threonine-protein kinase [Gemmatimonadaceae bacterium]